MNRFMRVRLQTDSILEKGKIEQGYGHSFLSETLFRNIGLFLQKRQLSPTSSGKIKEDIDDFKTTGTKNEEAIGKISNEDMILALAGQVRGREDREDLSLQNNLLLSFNVPTTGKKILCFDGQRRSGWHFIDNR